VSILAARDAIEAVSPPQDARKLHAELLQLYDLNASPGLRLEDGLSPADVFEIAREHQRLQNLLS